MEVWASADGSLETEPSGAQSRSPDSVRVQSLQKAEYLLLTDSQFCLQFWTWTFWIIRPSRMIKYRCFSTSWIRLRLLQLQKLARSKARQFNWPE